MKVRCVTFGKEQTLELVNRLFRKGIIEHNFFEGLEVRAPSEIRMDIEQRKARKRVKLNSGEAKEAPPNKLEPVPEDKETVRKTKKRSRSETSSSKPSSTQLNDPRDLFAKLFTPPPRCKSFRACVTTDGVSASWHIGRLKKELEGRKQKGKKKQNTKVIHFPLRPSQYGTHGEDVFVENVQNGHIVAVDPGHANIISCVRNYTTDKDMTGRSRRALLKDRKQKALGISTFDLKNTSWKDRTGQRSYVDYMKSVMDRNNMQEAIDLLAGASSRTTSSDQYVRHIEARMRTQPVS